MRYRRRVFLGYQFDSIHYDRTELLSVFEEACEMAENDLRRKIQGISLEARHEATQLGKPLSLEIINLVRGSSATVFELSDNNPNVMYELGIAYGQGIANPLILRSRKAKNKTLPSDIKGIFYLPYNNLQSIKGRLARNLLRIIRRQIEGEQAGDMANTIRPIWAGTSVSKKKINIICPTLPNNRKYRPSFASPRSSEYVELAKYGDLDALVELLEMLPILYPESAVNRMASQDVTVNHLKDNLIILGGPDFNGVARDFIDRVELPIRYKSGNREAEFEDTRTGRRYRMIIKSGRVHQDYGLFARFPNPFDPQKHVVMIGGLETFGVLGTARTFGFTAASRTLVRNVLNRCGPNPRFVALLKIPVLNSSAGVGQIDYSCFHMYPWHKN